MPAKSVTPRIWVENGWLKCKTPYDETVTPRFAAELKSVINWKLRQWSPSEKVWLVDPSCLDELLEIARRHFPKTVVMRETGAETAQSAPQEPRKRRQEQPDDGTYQTMANLLRVASTDALKRVYRALAADLHTDHGGDVETMKRLNVAWDRIRKERGVQ